MSQAGRLVDEETNLETLTGNTGGAILPDGAGNINIVGTTPMDVAGNPGTSTLTITVASATTTQEGVIEIATNAETIAGTDTTRAVTADDLKAKLGTQTTNSLPIGASTAAAISWTAAPTDGQFLIGSTGVTPALGTLTGGNAITTTNGAASITVDADNATTTQKGVIEIATNAEAIAGTDTSRAVTADDLKAKLGTQTTNSLPIGASTSSAISWTAAPTNGQILIGSTGVIPTLGTLTAGTNISITNGAGSIQIDATGGMTWNEVVGVASGMTADNGYIANNAALVTLTLPAVIPLGCRVRITGKGAGGWLIAQNAGQSINFGILTTTPGVGGSLASTKTFDSIELLCITANTQFVVLSSIGNTTVV